MNKDIVLGFVKTFMRNADDKTKEPRLQSQLNNATLRATLLSKEDSKTLGLLQN